MSENADVIKYETHGTCCKVMVVKVNDNKIEDCEFYGGCNGNLKGIRSLIKGMEIDEVIEKLEGTDCNGRGTSCPDQLAKCLIEYKEKKVQKV